MTKWEKDNESDKNKASKSNIGGKPKSERELCLKKRLEGDLQREDTGR